MNRNYSITSFFTTKSVGNGKSLGLSISQEIVRDMGGSIIVDRRPGQGPRSPFDSIG